MPSKKKAKSSPELTSALQHLLAKPSVDAERRMEEWEKSNDCGTIVLPLSMLDALKLAKETPGTKVRPVRGNSIDHVYWIGGFIFKPVRGYRWSPVAFTEDELLGSWEIVVEVVQ
jgi:hypothetical protein